MKKILSFFCFISFFISTIYICSFVVNAYNDEVSIMGDLDGDNNLSISDATLLQRYLVKLLSSDDIAIDNADFNGDNDVNIVDVTCIQKRLAFENNNIIETKNEESKLVWVVDIPAHYTEEPIFEYKYRTICLECGEDCTDNLIDHGKMHAQKNEGFRWGNYLVEVQVGTQMIFHKEEGHYSAE